MKKKFFEEGNFLFVRSKFKNLAEAGKGYIVSFQKKCSPSHAPRGFKKLAGMTQILLAAGKRFLLITGCWMAMQIAAAAQPIPVMDKKMDWWREARFGMFIHWGIYSVLGGDFEGHYEVRKESEWIMDWMKIPVAAYKKEAKNFNPVKFNAEAWVKMARDAGMKYIVFTAKHHDGFAMFNTKANHWNIVDATPYGKDVLKSLSEACRKYGIKFCIYYSQAQDWCNPGGAAARTPTSWSWPNPDSSAIDAYTASHGGHWDPYQTTKTMAEYIDSVAVPQVKELLTNYGRVAEFWWDSPHDMTKPFAEKLNQLLALQPGIIRNDRLIKDSLFKGDFFTPEQHIPKEKVKGKDFEVCMTMNDTWGFNKSDDNWKSAKTLVQNLVDIASKGGNFLLNVGPQPDGLFPQKSVDLLAELGHWMKVNGEAIYGTRATPLPNLPWGRSTMTEINKDTWLYLAVFEWPANGKLVVPGLDQKVISAALLANGKKIKTQPSPEGLILYLPAKAPDSKASEIKLKIKGRL